MSKTPDRYTYTFGEIVMTATRTSTKYKPTWYLRCSECHGEHMFRQTGSKVWHTSCILSGVEWTITPKEFYICKPVDLTLILGEENGDR